MISGPMPSPGISVAGIFSLVWSGMFFLGNALPSRVPRDDGET